MSEIYLKEELKKIGIGSCGDNVNIDRSVKFIHPENIHIGSNVRIDAWCFLSAKKNIIIGNNVHLSINAQLAGNGDLIKINDFCGISSRVSIFTATDDYSEGWLTNPTIPEQFKKVKTGSVILEKHAIVGCGSVIMPNCILKIGCSVGALSFVNKSIPEYTVVAGNPLRVICKRNKENLIKIERDFIKNEINK